MCVFERCETVVHNLYVTSESCCAGGGDGGGGGGGWGVHTGGEVGRIF